MIKLFAFNAGHEVSLMGNEQQYQTPRKEIYQIRKSLWPIMSVLADSHDLIYAFVGNPTLDFIVNANAEPIEWQNVPKEMQLVLWAWEPAFINYIKKTLHIRDIHLITPSITPRYRQLSHRFTSTPLVYQCVRNLNLNPLLTPYWIKDNENINNYINKLLQYGIQHIVIKRPFTSSGQGVFFRSIPLNEKEQLFLSNIIKRSECISIEPYWRVFDNWAIEYEIQQDGKVEFVALSHFIVDGQQYSGNMLKLQSILYDNLSTLIGEERLMQIIKLHKNYLSKFYPDYIGYVGVDMLLYHNNEGQICIYPAVEINLRMTMGLIAYFIQNKYVHSESARFVVASFDEFLQDNSKSKILINNQISCPQFAAYIVND